jgi:hypothetical protein
MATTSAAVVGSDEVVVLTAPAVGVGAALGLAAFEAFAGFEASLVVVSPARAAPAKSEAAAIRVRTMGLDMRIFLHCPAALSPD